MARTAISRFGDRVQRVCVGGRTMKRDTGDEIRMKLRYGRSNPWFSIRRVLSLPPSSPSPPTDTLLQFVCPCAGATRTNGVCNLEFRTRRKGFLFFFSPSLLLFPLLFPRVEIRDWCLTYSRIPGKKQFRGGGNSNSREGGIKSRYVFERREFEKGNCGKVVGRVVEGLKT